MKETKEAVEVTVKETQDVEEDRVKELALQLNTLDGTEASLITPLINGTLLAGIITSNTAVHITISFADNPNIIIYEMNDFIGSFYLPFMISSVSHSGKVFNFAPSNWILNDALKINIKGSAQTNTEIKLRYK